MFHNCLPFSFVINAKGLNQWKTFRENQTKISLEKSKYGLSYSAREMLNPKQFEILKIAEI